MHCPLFVAHENVLDTILVEQRVVQIEHSAAGIAEHMFDIFLLQAAHDDFRAAKFFTGRHDVFASKRAENDNRTRR